MPAENFQEREVWARLEPGGTKAAQDGYAGYITKRGQQWQRVSVKQVLDRFHRVSKNLG